MGMTIAITCGASPMAEATTPRKKRKYSRKTVPTADTTSADTDTTTAGTEKKKTRKMTSVGTAAIKQASTQYHARIRELRNAEGLTLKQARKRYQVLKTQAST
jgi:hypothetical protein